MSAIIDEEKCTFDSETNTLILHHDWQSDEPVSTAIIRGIAALTNTPPTELDSLYDVVNSDALNQLYRPTAANSRQQDGGHAMFRVNDCDIVVYANAKIEISPPDDGEE